MSPAAIQAQAVISYFLSSQDRKAGASTGVYEFDSVVRG